MSDLHMENHPFSLDYIGEDVLVLGGDIYSGIDTVKKIKTLLVKGEYPQEIPVLWLPGNHEYYSRRSMKELNALFAKECKGTQIVFMNNKKIVIDCVRFIGSTLWTTFTWDIHSQERVEFNMRYAKNHINDFFAITGENGRFTADECKALGHQNIKWIDTQLDKKSKYKTVLLTHFVPFLESIHPMYAGDNLNPYFTNDLGKWFGKVDLVIHGHTHSSCDYVKHGTRVVCNPRGYYNESSLFDPYLLVEV